MANPMHRVVISMHNPRLFWRKVVTVSLALFALQPLLYFKLYLPATLYLGIILAIHVIFLYVYVLHMPWRDLAAHKRALVGRVIGIIIVGYALGLIKTAPNLWVIFINIVAMITLHSMILALLMLKQITLVSTNK